jgi:hypothetical protein
MENIRRGRLALFDRADKLGMIGPSVYAVVETNGKHFIYNSRPRQKRPPSDAALVCLSMLCSLMAKDYADWEKEWYYPHPE